MANRYDDMVSRCRRRARRASLFVAAVALATAGVVATPPVASADQSFAFNGGGWGHGVGMSQYGACGMAKQGSSATAILSHYYTGTSVQTRSEPSGLRVLLDDSAAFTLTTAGPTTFAGIGDVPGGNTVKVTRSGNDIILSGAVNRVVAGAVSVDPKGSALSVRPPAKGRFNRGTIQFSLNGAGGLSAMVTGLSTRDYLYGLGEVPSSWPAAALQAQAIAGRTIAQSLAGRSGTYDLSSKLNGTYIGYDQEAGPSNKGWVDAVNATTGEVITYGGAPITSAVYSSSSGGRTAASSYVWGGDPGYLRVVADPADNACGNPNFHWSVVFSGAELGHKLGIPAVRSISVGGNIGITGRLDRADIRFTSVDGTTHTFTGSKLRSALGLRSTLFSIAGAARTPAPSAPPNRPPTATLSDVRAHNGRNLLVAGRANDPDGTPRMFVADSLNGKVQWKLFDSAGGYFLGAWPVQPGKHTTCVAVLDNPTGAATNIGCRDTVIK